MYVDTHCHLNMVCKKLDDLPLEELLQDITTSGVKRMMTISAAPEDLKWVLETSSKYENVFGSLGIHPHDACNFKDTHFDFVKNNIKKPKIVAIGEIGLDYHYNFSEQSTQKEVFKKFLQLAKEVEMPVVIHTREAEEDTLAIFNEIGNQIKGVIHCYTGSLEFAQNVINNFPGLYLGFTGVITFKNANEIREVVEAVPLERMLMETDSPFMAPVPYRGKICKPNYVIEVVEKVAQIKGVSVEDVIRITNQNSKIFFEQGELAEC